jgi:hypothetical protein
MKEEIKELITAERRRADFSFISKVIQRGHIRPSTYIHEIGIPYELYEEMSARDIIDHEYYFLSKQAFFEFKREEVVISFVHMYACEDFHHIIDRFIIINCLGKYPVRRAGVSKMNFDKKIEMVVLMRNKTGKKSRP